MTRINQDYIYIDEWENLKDVRLEESSLYIYAHDPEVRSTYCAEILLGSNPNTRFLKIEFIDTDDSIKILNEKDASIISLHSDLQIGNLLGSYKENLVYLEVTGLSCRVAAPLMKFAMQNGINMRIVYVEPQNYNLEKFWNQGVNKDLCEKVNGINPLPGLANIVPYSKPPLFVVLLGFEGGRLSYLLQDQSPMNSQIIPVLGVPGYQLHYPFISMWGNRYQIRNTKCWQRLKYAEANSIVDIYMLLKNIHTSSRGSHMIIAPIGTKPHAIGAILYSIKHSKDVEIVYDNPKRSVHRTDGIGKVLVCDITKLYKEN